MKKLWQMFSVLWECNKEQKNTLLEFTKKHGFKLIEKIDTSLTLGCFNLVVRNKKGRVNLTDEFGNILDENLTVRQANKEIDSYEKAAKKEKITVEQYLKNLIKSRRKKIKLKNPERLGELSKTGAPVRLTLVDDAGNVIGDLVRSSVKRHEIKYTLAIQGQKGKRELFSTVQLLDENIGQLRKIPVAKGEKLVYHDFAIPKSITNQFSGLGDIMLDDSLQFFINNKNLGKVDGALVLLIRDAKLYEEYGGESLLLRQFWDAVKAGKTYEEAAFSTFAGEWAKKVGFNTFSVRDIKRDIRPDNVLIKFTKK